MTGLGEGLIFLSVVRALSEDFQAGGSHPSVWEIFPIMLL